MSEIVLPQLMKSAVLGSRNVQPMIIQEDIVNFSDIVSQDMSIAEANIDPKSEIGLNKVEISENLPKINVAAPPMPSESAGGRDDGATTITKQEIQISNPGLQANLDLKQPAARQIENAIPIPVKNADLNSVQEKANSRDGLKVPADPPSKVGLHELPREMLHQRLPAEKMMSAPIVKAEPRTDVPVFTHRQDQRISTLSTLSQQLPLQSAGLGIQAAFPVMQQPAKPKEQSPFEMKATQTLSKNASPTTSAYTTFENRPTEAVQMSRPTDVMAKQIDGVTSEKMPILQELSVKGEPSSQTLTSRVGGDVSQTQSTQSTPSQNAQIAKSIATQMAVAVTQNGGGMTEIRLSPDELGKVRMLVTAQDNAISMVIQAERPETGDTLRRHIETLAQEFRNMGYRSISFTFEGGQSNQSDDTHSSEQEVADALESLDDGNPPQAENIGNETGLDLRL